LLCFAVSKYNVENKLDLLLLSEKEANIHFKIVSIVLTEKSIINKGVHAHPTFFFLCAIYLFLVKLEKQK